MARIFRPAETPVWFPQVAKSIDDELTRLERLERRITEVSADTELTNEHYTVLADATSAAVTLTLPTAESALGRIYHVKKIDASANAVTLDGNGSETIDGAANKSTTTQYAGFTVQSDGTEWWLL